MPPGNDPTRPCPERSVTSGEAAVIQWLLDNAPVRDVSAYRVRPVKELRVVEVCTCGCASLFFASGRHPGLRMISDAMAEYPDGHEANLLLWGQDDEVIWLEVNDLGPAASFRVPEVADLRTWEQWGAERLK